MKFEVILRYLMDAARTSYDSHGSTELMAQAINDALNIVRAECDDVLGQVLFNPLIIRDEGPIMTATVFRRDSGTVLTYGDVVATGLIRLRSNHRVIAYTTQQLGRQDVTQYRVKYVEGRGDHGHVPTPAFDIGDVTKTDQALRYLMSCWALMGCRNDLADEGAPEPLSNTFLIELAAVPYDLNPVDLQGCPWPTDQELERSLRPRFLAEAS